MEYTLALIKPDAFKAGKAAEMQQLVQLHDFSIVARKQLQLTQNMAEEFYAEHKGKPFYPGLVEFMTSGPIVALVLAKAGAIRGWRELMGPTDVFEARVRAPKTMRALYGTDGTCNSCHGSDSPASAAREIKFFFPDLKLDTTAAVDDTKAYIEQKLNPTLLKALTALARQKPSSQPAEAVVFLANWLLEHNPNKPRVAVPQELLQQQQRQLQEVQLAAAAAADAAAAAVAKQQAVAQKAVSGGKGAQEAGVQQSAGDAGVVVGEEDLQQAAATKVQSAFRGHQARKQVAGMRQSQADAAEAEAAEAAEVDAPAVEEAPASAEVGPAAGVVPAAEEPAVVEGPAAVVEPVAEETGVVESAAVVEPVA